MWDLLLLLLFFLNISTFEKPTLENYREKNLYEKMLWGLGCRDVKQ